MNPEILVVKVGGSLYDLPDLGTRLTAWLRGQEAKRILLIPGGGPAADVIRAYDRTHQFGEEAAHWLALHMLHVNAQLLHHLLPKAPVVATPWEAAALAILDAEAFARADEARPDHVPHTWNTTSDALAVRVANLAQARELILLKSVACDGADWEAAARRGVVDAHFPEIVRTTPALQVRVLNLRSWQSAP